MKTDYDIVQFILFIKSYLFIFIMLSALMQMVGFSKRQPFNASTNIS